MSTGWGQREDNRYFAVRLADGPSLVNDERHASKDPAVDGAAAGGTLHGMEPMEIESSTTVGSGLPAAPCVPCFRWTCRRLATACCALAILLCLASSAAAAYVGGIVPHFHPPSRSCPELGETNRLIQGPLDLKLNREARILSPPELGDLHGAHFGFRWNKGDNHTKKWRPQGISTLDVSSVANTGQNRSATGRVDQSAQFVLVSWYGRIDQQYYNRGARVSFVKLPETASRKEKLSIPYRHVLLVDKHWDTFPFLHAGGLTMDPSNNMLHVPDSRYPWNYRVHVFNPMESLYDVPPCQRSRFYDYAYVLQESYSYAAPIKPSFLSYDAGRNYVVMGTYSHCSGETQHVDSEHCLRDDANQLAWYSLSEQRGEGPSHVLKCAPFFADMQGVASAQIRRGDTVTDGAEAYGTNLSALAAKENVLWVSSSYSAKNASHLHVVRGFDPDEACDGYGKLRSDDMAAFNVTTFSFPPPGLEDLHLQQGKAGPDGSNWDSSLWMLTEFRSRIVFATRTGVFL